MNDGGKGSKPRPLSVSQAEYDNRWDAIFGRDQPPEPKRTHWFVHDGWGRYECNVCGRKERYASHGETCPGKPSEAK